jgi:hypothetical protein
MVVQNITGTYNLVANSIWQTLVLQEVRLECDTSLAPVTINLFEIADLKRLWNVKIYITDIAANASVNNITINSSGSDTIDGTGNTSITINENGVSAVFAVVNQTQWVALESNATPITPVPATNAYGLFAQTADSPLYEDSTDPRDLIGAGVGTLTVPPDTFKVGDTFLLKMGGKISVQNNNTLRIRLLANGGSIILLDFGFVSLGGATDKNWLLESNFTIRQIGAATIANIHSDAIFRTQRDGGQQFEGYVADTENNTDFDTTISNTLQVEFTWGTQSINNTIKSDFFVLTKVY